jgi:L,D-transpeptidase ErfK/SrfK
MMILKNIAILLLLLIIPSGISSQKFIKKSQTENYFQYLDSIVKNYNEKVNYKLTEHLLVRYNPWIIDTLAYTDYYKMMEKDSFVYNQKELIVLRKGNRILLPDSLAVLELLNTFNKTYLDINVPEFKLRIVQDSIELFEFPIRVGRNERKYLKMGDRITDLRTKLGIGKIVNHVKDPDYYNPANGHQYYLTRRDDNKVTKLPQIPWLETEINGVRDGQLIHPTTNPNTLSKAYSNGCIGTKEGDAWIIYYYAPINTKVAIMYNLKRINKLGDTITLTNIYGY